jgi:hypothetical protein
MERHGQNTATNRITRRGFAATLSAALVPAVSEPVMTLAISMNLVPDANLNDARTAMRMWLDWADRSHQMAVRMAPGVFVPSGELLQMIRMQRVDAFAMDAGEYRQVAERVDPRWVIAADYSAEHGGELVLVARRDSAIRSLRDLRGKRLLRWRNPVTRLSDEWLAVQQMRAGGPGDLRFWASSGVENKLSRAVLPVFFNQHDACLVTRRGFATMCEMNPQVAERLHPILTSPSMCTGGYFFRKGCPARARERMLETFVALGTAPYGEQLLRLFQSPRLLVRDASCLKEALELLDEFARLKLPGSPA